MPPHRWNSIEKCAIGVDGLLCDPLVEQAVERDAVLAGLGDDHPMESRRTCAVAERRDPHFSDESVAGLLFFSYCLPEHVRSKARIDVFAVSECFRQILLAA